MIILLHGDNISASRDALTSFKLESKDREIRELNGNGLDATSLTQALESGGLFGTEVLIVLENFLSKSGKKGKTTDELLNVLVKDETNANVILWEGKEITPAMMKRLGGHVDARLFKTPKVIFQLLDGLRPHGGVALLPLLGQTLQTDAAELFFSMFIKRIRQLIMLREGVLPEGLQGWQATRLTSQSKLFTIDKLLSMEKRLLEIDVSIKTGASPFPLAQQIELFFIDL